MWPAWAVWATTMIPPWKRWPPRVAGVLDKEPHASAIPLDVVRRDLVVVQRTGEAVPAPDVAHQRRLPPGLPRVIVGGLFQHVRLELGEGLAGLGAGERDPQHQHAPDPERVLGARGRAWSGP